MKNFALLVCLFFTSCALAQDNQTLPVSTQALLSGVKSMESKNVLKSVMMIVCMKDQKKGTGFVLTGGSIVTTNSHVVGNCSAQELFGISSVTNEQIHFTGMQLDTNRDLALLCVSKPLPFSMKLGADKQAPVETEVETWGYPLAYHQPAPLLSRGYVAGYNADVRQPGATPVKHLVINGAFNPGNSGGPLIDRSTGKVIGIVVTKWTLWSPNIEVAIQGFSHPSVGTGGTFSKLNAQGQRVGVTDQEMISTVLDEFYQTSQVMIGEAISVSELNAFVQEKKKDLACASK
jgi:S1-C subfamily serine protease